MNRSSHRDCLPMKPNGPRKPRPTRAVFGTAVLALLAACSAPPKLMPLQEDFGSVATYSRLFDATPAQTCEAGRRALLSQGYVVNTSSTDLVEGQKNFQPDAESHLQMIIRVVCVPETPGGTVSLGFVTAQQDRYALKKTNTSASVGVGSLGSLSLPFAQTSDALVKVGSKTIDNDSFYDTFFDIVKRFVAQGDAPVPDPR